MSCHHLRVVNVDAVIIAGGASSRMRESAPLGTPDKPLLEHLPAGPRLIDAAIDAARAVIDGRIVVVGPPLDLPVDVHRVREDPPLSGPAAAIAAGVAATDAEQVLILAADVARPSVIFDALLAPNPTSDSHDGRIIVTDGQIQPVMCLLDGPRAREAFAGVRGGSIRKVLATLVLEEVELPAAAAADVDTWDAAEAAGIGVSTGAASWISARDRVHAFGAIFGPGMYTPLVTPLPGAWVTSDVCSPMDIPHYTSSAMDGFAVAGSGPWELLAEPAQGAQGRNVHRTGGSLQPGQALPILTGSLLPDRADRIVRTEHARVSAGRVELLEGITVKPGADIRHAGEELREGEVLVQAGTRLSPRHVALLATCGVDKVPTHSPLRVDFAFTGNEVITSGIPSPGEVRDAFSTSFPALVREWGGIVNRVDRLGDDPDDVHDWLTNKDSLLASILVLTGGSGHSGQDFVRRAIMDTADVILAESVHCQPGHPTLLALRSTESGPQLIVGAPGNPLAAHVALHSFVHPALAVGLGRDFPATVPVKCQQDIPAIKRNRVRLIPARITPTGAIPLTKTHSHMLSGYAHADVLIVAPPEGVTAGQSIPTLELLSHIPTGHVNTFSGNR